MTIDVGRSIEIIGSNGIKMKLITEDKIDTIIKERELTYNLYKQKYLDSNNNIKCNLTENHLLIQLISTFYNYDNSQSFNYNLYKFQQYLKQLSSTMNLIEYINCFMIQNNLLNKLNLSILTILKKIFTNTSIEADIEFIELNNNYYLDLLMLIHLLEEKCINENDNSNQCKLLLVSLKESIKNLEDFITSISIITINNKNKKFLEDNNICLNIISNLDFYLENIKSIKGNILKIDSLINIIIENIYKFYNIIE